MPAYNWNQRFVWQGAARVLRQEEQQMQQCLQQPALPHAQQQPVLLHVDDAVVLRDPASCAEGHALTYRDLFQRCVFGRVGVDRKSVV